MASYQILYWQNIPSQIKVWNDFDEDKVELPQKFITRIDIAAKEQGLTAEDDYLSQWRWGDEKERPGSVQDVLEALIKELEQELDS